jgi:N12 class adenine-specific DNA methylase
MMTIKFLFEFKASLAVGSIKADLESFKGLKHHLPLKQNRNEHRNTKNLIRTIRKKFDAINQKTDTHLEGLALGKTNNLLGLYSNGCLVNLTNPKNHFARRNGFYYVSSSQ